MSDTFERIADWLQRVALLDVGLEELIEGLGTRLVEAGVPVVRISQGRLLMHPIIGVIDVTWDADAKRTDWAVYPRAGLSSGLAKHYNSPFAELNRANQEIAKSWATCGVWSSQMWSLTCRSYTMISPIPKHVKNTRYTALGYVWHHWICRTYRPVRMAGRHDRRHRKVLPRLYRFLRDAAAIGLYSPRNRRFSTHQHASDGRFAYRDGEFLCL